MESNVAVVGGEDESARTAFGQAGGRSGDLGADGMVGGACTDIDRGSGRQVDDAAGKGHGAGGLVAELNGGGVDRTRYQNGAAAQTTSGGVRAEVGGVAGSDGGDA